MKLVIIEPLGVEKEKLLAIAGEYVSDRVEIIYYDTKVTDTATLIERGKDADIIVVSNLPMNGEVIRGCDKLKLLSVAFTGVDHIDLSACREKGVTVCNCAGYSTAAVADLVFGMVIALYRNLIPCNDVVRQGGTKDGLVGMELEGKKFGVVAPVPSACARQRSPGLSAVRSLLSAEQRKNCREWSICLLKSFWHPVILFHSMCH